MTTLYKLGGNLQELAEQIQELLEDGAEPNSNQVQELLGEMVGADNEWQQKATNVALYIKNTESDIDALDKEIKRLTAKKNKLKKSTAYLEELLIGQMTRFNINEVKHSLITIKLRKNPPSVVVVDEDKIPMEYKKVSYTVDKTAIKKVGGVEGAEITNTFGLKYA